jgi:hypothetical protein
MFLPLYREEGAGQPWLSLSPQNFTFYSTVAHIGAQALVQILPAILWLCDLDQSFHLPELQFLHL